ncbi:MAG: segregation/condensation protein A [Candidatus Krumholzibacteriia bacterium]
MIRLRHEPTARDTAGPAILAPADPSAPPVEPVWSLDQLPPELEYFRTSDAYQVELADFQGPMDLLLYLIQKDEIDVYDIPIAHITEQFLAHVEIIRSISLDRAGEFIAMAATLLVIKMKMLMPRHGEEQDDEGVEDPRAELVRRLLEYKRFKQAAEALRGREEDRRQYFVRTARYPFVDRMDLEPELRIDMFELLAALGGIFDRLQAPPVHQVQREPYTVEEKIELIRERFRQQATVHFEELFADDAIKMEVVVTFIAILEMIKRGEALFLQTEPWGPIWVQPRQRDDAADDGDDWSALTAARGLAGGDVVEEVVAARMTDDDEGGAEADGEACEPAGALRSLEAEA